MPDEIRDSADQLSRQPESADEAGEAKPKMRFSDFVLQGMGERATREEVDDLRRRIEAIERKLTEQGR